MKSRGADITVSLLLAVVLFSIYGLALSRKGGPMYEIESVLESVQSVLLTCLLVWCITLLMLAFSPSDIPLVGLLVTCVIAYFISLKGRPAREVLTILFTVILGKGARFVLHSAEQKTEGRRLSALRTPNSRLRMFVIGLVALLSVSVFWHLDTANNLYHGPRWMGLWNNPNDYGLLMAAGLVLAIGLLVANRKLEIRNRKLDSVLLVATFMLGIGLLFSYSRGSWLGTSGALIYLAWWYGKLKWRFFLPVIFLMLAVTCFFWKTPRTAPWYLQRLDLSRGSVQHRIAAWKAGFEIMHDHPFGVGWNKVLGVYQKNYSPPEHSATAIITNDFVMLGTQLGVPALLCFLAYVALCFRKFAVRNSEFAIFVACRAGVIVFLVAFWFDDGLFKLATGSVFWILLELGANAGTKSYDYKTELSQSTCITT